MKSSKKVSLRVHLGSAYFAKNTVDKSKNGPTSQNEDWQSYRNVWELQAVGIYLKCNKKVSLRVCLESAYFVEIEIFFLKVL